jgi:hypothetical protein
MSLFVIKADGTKQLFDREKVKRTCLRMGASRNVAEDVVDKIEKRIYNGISTDMILKMIFKFLRKYKPTIKHLLDLRKGLSLMSSKVEFELFVRILLSEQGYEVYPNKIIKGKCVEHEVDAIATINNITYFVEAKHHSNYHTPTGLDESRIARAVLEYLTEGFEIGLNGIEINRAMIVTNTRFSEHARRYGKCRNIFQVGWNTPIKYSLQDVIEEKKLHPLTCLKGLDKRIKDQLASVGIILMKQLVEEKPEDLERRIGVPKRSIAKVIDKVKICSCSLYHY